MNITYIVNTRIPTEKAHGYQIVQVCNELAKAGAHVELYVPRRKNTIQQDAFSYYGIDKNFTITYIPAIDFFIFEKIIGRMTYYFQALSFLISLFFKKIPKDTIVYSRNPEVVFLMNLKGIRSIFNAHNWPTSSHRLRKLIKHARGIVCNSKGTQQEFITHNFSPTVAIPNGVDLSYFNNGLAKHELRKRRGLPLEKTLVMYVGHLYAWKGVDVIIDAAALSKDDSVRFVIVGGTKKDHEKYQQILQEKKLTNVILVAHQQRDVIPECIMAADLVVLPNIPQSKESEKYTSPIKMFEYMASLVPIIASDMPSLREVLNESNATLIEAGNAQALARTIEEFKTNPNVYTEKSVQAYQDVQQYTWSNHAEKLLNFIKKTCVES